MAAMKRADAVAYAKNHWFRPTDDNLVWAKSFAINVVTLKASLLAKKKVEADWEPVFLRKIATDVSTGTPGEADGLYFVDPAHVGTKFLEKDIPASDRFLAHDWFGTAGVPGSPGGLNDCTAYVSHCLVAGGVTYLGPSSPGDVWPTRGAQQIYNLLSERPATQVKRLTNMAGEADVELVFKALAHIVKPGDVLTFARNGRNGHCGMLVTVDSTTGDARMTCHSTLDHADLPGEGTWQIRTTPEHPFVSVLHFSHDDPPLGALTALAGWWTVTMGSSTYYYFLLQGGGCRWVSKKPTGAGAPGSPKGRGHWFAGTTADSIVIAWESGTVDEVTLAADKKSFTGKENRTAALTGAVGVA
ncbi:amidase domain-containing protein [Agromyces cerinus subsp. nitratus]|uniref:amidase domain-containing protein n=2 Tax=Agromyces cerinus TaxID=33878 RepID=UPI00362F54F7